MRAFDTGERRNLVRVRDRCAHYVKGFDSAGGEGVRDEASVATPGNRFRAHNYGRSVIREFDETPKGGIESGSVHVIRVSAEGIIPPGGVDRVFARMTQSAQAGFVFVTNPMSRERRGHRLAIVLRIPAGLRNGSDIDQIVHAVTDKHRDEIVEWMRGVANGVNAPDTFRIVS